LTDWRKLMAIGAASCIGVSAIAADKQLAASIAAATRTPAFAARDGARHPLQELAFFGLKPTDTVVEIWPEPGYWTEILAPYLKAKGTYYVALSKPVASGPEAGAEDKFKAKLAADPADYGAVKVTELARDEYDVAPPDSADLILTFRNLHNWMSGGYADAVLAGFYKALKPGGTLGIEDHRARADKPQDPAAKSGYVRQDYAIELAKKAGFEFVASSEIDANKKDTADWPKGVWTLPPSFAMGDQDHAKYAAIGEADNFVLKFRKPLH
jgi:predicted methyltransferase